MTAGPRTTCARCRRNYATAAFYSGAIDGAYSSDLALALTRYQIRNGLPITGQLDAETSKALMEGGSDDNGR